MSTPRSRPTLRSSYSPFCNPPTVRSLTSFVFIVFVCSFVLFFFSGCSTLHKWALNQGYRDSATVEKQINEIRSSGERALEKKESELATRYSESIKARQNQIQGAANGLYGAQKTFDTIKEPNRTDLVINNFVNESWTALGNIMPDHDTMIKINERMKKDLNETLTTLDELKRRHQIQIDENKKLADLSASKDKEINDLQKAIEAQKLDTAQKIAAKQGDLLAIQKKIVALEQERADNKQWIETQKWRMITITGGLALLCVAGAIWSPVFKVQFVIGAAVFGAIASAIPFIQPWMILVAAGVVGIGIAIYMVLEHNKQNKVAVAVTRAIQDIKNNAKDQYEAILKPKLDEWTTKYDKDGKPVPDTTVRAQIDKILIQSGDK